MIGGVNTFKNLSIQLRTRIAVYRGAELDEFAHEAGVSSRWLLDFREGRAPNPTVRHLDRVNNALLKRDKRAPRQ